MAHTKTQEGEPRQIMEVSVIIPCLNEEATVGTCVEKSLRALKESNLTGEVVVVDNGSTDRSIEISKAAGARIVHAEVKGYGSAIRAGIESAHGDAVIMGDADDTYDFGEIGALMRRLREGTGADLVMGNRYGGKIHRKAMPFLNRLVGTPVLTLVMRIFFKSKVSDINCGLRAFKRDSMQRLNLKCNGMELASKCSSRQPLKNWSSRKYRSVFSLTRMDGFHHLNPLRDGWRHLRVMLALCPKYLFVYPGLILSATSLVLLGLIQFDWFRIFGQSPGISTSAFASALFFIGIQVILFGIHSITYNSAKGLIKDDRMSSFFKKHFTLERGLTVGGILLAIGGILGITTLFFFYQFANNQALRQHPVHPACDRIDFHRDDRNPIHLHVFLHEFFWIWKRPLSRQGIERCDSKRPGRIFSHSFP